jgi:uncharacterized protein YacL (UPF0231 family)
VQVAVTSKETKFALEGTENLTVYLNGNPVLLRANDLVIV